MWKARKQSGQAHTGGTEQAGDIGGKSWDHRATSFPLALLSEQGGYGEVQKWPSPWCGGRHIRIPSWSRAGCGQRSRMCYSFVGECFWCCSKSSTRRAGTTTFSCSWNVLWIWLYLQHCCHCRKWLLSSSWTFFFWTEKRKSHQPSSPTTALGATVPLSLHIPTLLWLNHLMHSLLEEAWVDRPRLGQLGLI